jgi:hypothetical protein
MSKSVDVVRTINNQMIVGKTIETPEKVVVLQPYGLIPTKEGLTLIPYDIDLTGVKMDQIAFKQEHVLYTTVASEQLAAEYIRILEEAMKPQVQPQAQPEPEAQAQETQETQEQA